MNVVQQYIGDKNANLGLLVVIGLGVLLIILIHLKGRK